MSDRLTPGEIEMARAAWEPMFSAKDAEDRLLDLLDAGFEIKFPEPRYYVEKRDNYWVDVKDRDQSGNLVAAVSWGWLSDAQEIADDIAARLNAEATA